MKKLLTILLISVFAMGCSKDDKKKPTDALMGSWKGIMMEVLYEDAAGDPYRNDVITGNISNNNPMFTLIMKETSFTVRNDDGHEEKFNYTKDNNEIELIADGRKRIISYSISGKTLVLKNTEKNEKVTDDIVVPKVTTIIRLEKINPN